MFGRRRDEETALAGERYELLEHAAYYLRLAKADPDHPARYADLAEQFTAVAIQAGVTPAEAEARLVAGLGDQ